MRPHPLDRGLRPDLVKLPNVRVLVRDAVEDARALAVAAAGDVAERVQILIRFLGQASRAEVPADLLRAAPEAGQCRSADQVDERRRRLGHAEAHRRGPRRMRGPVTASARIDRAFVAVRRARHRLDLLARAGAGIDGPFAT